MSYELEYRHYNLPTDFPILALLKENFSFPVESSPEIKLLHFHNCLEICYCNIGDKCVMLEDKRLVLHSKEVCIIPPYVAHMIKNRVFPQEPGQDECEYFYADLSGLLRCFYPNGIPEQLLSYNFTGFENIIEPFENPKVREYVVSVLDELRFQKSGYQYAVRALILSLLMELHRMMPEAAETSHSNFTQIPAIFPAIEYINDHYMNRIEIEFLAEICYMSLTNFNRCFKKLINLKPLKYINHIRLRKACELLYGTGDTILNIALTVGFDSVSSFNRNFMEEFHKTPSQWRKEKCAVQKKNLKHSTFHY